MVVVWWHDHDCQWVTKFCDEHHLRSSSVPVGVLRQHLIDPPASDRPGGSS